MGYMPNVYFSVAAFFVAILLLVVYFSKSRTPNTETKLYSFMLIVSLIDSILSMTLISVAYINYEPNILFIKILNKIDILQYLVWTNLLFLYIAEISLKRRALYRKLRARIRVISLAACLLIYAVAICAPILLYNKDGTMYAYGASIDIIYVTVGVYLFLMILVVSSNIKRIVNKKYIPVLVFLLLGAVVMIIRSTHPGLIIAPAVIAYINLIMFFTIENPDKKLAEQREKQNRELSRLDKAKDEFLSLASHQLRTPLTSTRGYADMLLDGDFGKLNNFQRTAVQEIANSSERMIFLVRDFLNVSRLQAGNFVLDRIKTNLADLLDEELDQLQNIALSHNIKLIYKPPSTRLPELNLDRERISEIMSNLVDNAIFYSPAGRTVVIHLSQIGDSIEFKVVDHGIGVPAKEQYSLFDKFFRGSNARTMRPDGTGIGLFLVKKVISEHGGKIIFHSAENKGSTFGFRLPIK